MTNLVQLMDTRQWYTYEWSYSKGTFSQLLPFPMRKAIETELGCLVEQGVIEAVDATTTPIEWASPIYLCQEVKWENHICVDFKTTNDPNSTLTPSITNVMSRLSGSRYFIKLDLRDAYLKMEVYVTSLKIEVDVAYPKYGYFIGVGAGGGQRGLKPPQV